MADLGGTMNYYRKIQHWGGASIFVISCIAICLNCNDKGTNPQARLQDLYDSTQITGWIPDSSSHFVQYPADSLYRPKDGGAPTYIDSGCVSWFFEKMNGGPTASSVGGDYVFMGYIMDLGTSKNARALYGAKIAANIAPYPVKKVTLGQYSDNEAQAITVGGGIQVFATFGKFYIEFSLNGFLASQIASIAVPEALKFLDKYKATIY
jgi:hypothetical protein